MAIRRYELTVRGTLAQDVLEVIRSRFDRVSATCGNRSVLVVDDLDQAAVRALLTLLWDTGHELLEMRSVGADHPG
ncbi:hypothetical protein GCM10009836_23520 [Pseudonocardia ailaonensis]|uniref:Uncharacterized protein n=1 Tax=Pseudonocardia ailaonensis TaxID=367279 RepID=A0ABN2MXS2_9PSEU